MMTSRGVITLPAKLRQALGLDWLFANGGHGNVGGKEDVTVEVYLGLLALRTGRPVKMVWTRQESLLARAKQAGVPVDAAESRYAELPLVVLVGEDPASQVYVRSKGKSTLEAGMVLSIETTMNHPRRGLVKIEDTVLVTDTGWQGLGDGVRGWQRTAG